MMQTWDDRRQIAALKNREEAIHFAASHWLHTAERAVQQRGRFAVALSGGSTPKEIFQVIVKEKQFAWEKVFLFWSDERGVPPNHPDSNYHMAMESGFQSLPIPKTQIFRMHAENHPEANALAYEKLLHQHLDHNLFDLVMLGMGEDGHTASLFPGSPALQVENRLVAAQYLPEKKNWRMTLTFPCINQSSLSVIYALGPSKTAMIQKVLQAAIISPYPASRIGTHEHPALWITDSPLNYTQIN